MPSSPNSLKPQLSTSPKSLKNSEWFSPAALHSQLSALHHDDHLVLQRLDARGLGHRRVLAAHAQLAAVVPAPGEGQALGSDGEAVEVAGSDKFDLHLDGVCTESVGRLTVVDDERRGLVYVLELLEL